MSKGLHARNAMTDERRVVVTGVGVLAANGIGKDAFWRSLVAGESGIRRVTLCDVTGLESQIAGEVKGFHPESFLAPRFKSRHVSRTAQFALAATRLALEDAALDVGRLGRVAPVAVSFGISMGGFDFIETEIRRIAAKGLNAMRPSVIGCIHVASASLIEEFLGVPARVVTFSNSCVGGMDAILDVARQIREGRAEVGLGGASDAPVVTCLMSGFCAARMLSTRNDHPERASRPFDLHRDRGVLAEGSAVLILESLEHALARGAVPYLELLAGADATDIPGRPASGMAAASREALGHAGMTAGDIACVFAHGPSDIDTDREECRCIEEVWGPGARTVPVTSIKGCTGNPLAAGGAMQVAAAALACRHGTIPPTANYEVPDPACALDIVAGRARRFAPGPVLVQSHGMGHVNASLIARGMNEGP